MAFLILLICTLFFCLPLGLRYLFNETAKTSFGIIVTAQSSSTNKLDDLRKFAANDYEHLKAHGKADFKSANTIEGKAVSHLFRRSTANQTCPFITNGTNVVAVGTSGMNNGYAMHNDQECSYGSWCPYACEPGMLMAQFDSSITTYEGYPTSMRGGIYCSENGEIQLTNVGKGYCYEGKGTVSVNNMLSSNVAFCQTVLPGNEEMLIPTNVDAGANQVLAVPGTEYWAKTASHFYINPPGVSTAEGCFWGSTANPWGNWAPYVAGANMDDNENTFVKIGWNPVYFEDTSPFKNTKPSFGLQITCPDGDCEGLPCIIDPASDDLNYVTGPSGSESNFCVVTATNNSSAVIEVFVSGGSSTNATQKREHHEHPVEGEKKKITVYKTVTISQTV